MRFFFFPLLVAYQCEHMVKGEEGLKLTHNLMAAPGFELVLPSLPSVLLFENKTKRV